MKRMIGIAVLTLCCASTAAAQSTAPRGGARSAPPPAMDKAAIERTLIANEQKINEAAVKGDLAAFKALVADDAWSIDEMMGASPVSEFEKQLKPGIAKVTDMKLDNFKVVWVDDNTAVLTYSWTGKGTYMDMPVKPSYVSTVFTKRGDKWLAVFHQETPKSMMPMPMKKQP